MRSKDTAEELSEQAGPIREDTLLGGRVRFFQPEYGYRVGIDPVILASAVPEGRAGHVLDVGSGTGAAALCLLSRMPLDRISGIEWNATYAEMSRDSLRINGYDAVSEIICADLRTKPPQIPGSVFDVVITNPPYHTTGTRSPDRGRSVAHMEGIPLKQWIDFCLRCLRPGGTFVVIHRADRLQSLLHALWGRAGAIDVIPLWPRAGVDAKRVIVRAKKGSTAPVKMVFGLVLHTSNGSEFTAVTQMILREGKGLDEALASQALSIPAGAG